MTIEAFIVSDILKDLQDTDKTIANAQTAFIFFFNFSAQIIIDVTIMQAPAPSKRMNIKGVSSLADDCCSHQIYSVIKTKNKFE
jgi:hypothetical protein